MKISDLMFHEGSTIMTLVAAVKVRPSPPTLALNKKILGASVLDSNFCEKISILGVSHSSAPCNKR